MKDIKNLLAEKDEIKNQIKKYFKDNKFNTAIIGISGGVDSAVGLNLLCEILNKKNIKAYFIDIESSKKDYLDARQLCSDLGVNLNYVDLNKLFAETVKTFNNHNELSLKNLKSRLRMVFLYNEATIHNGLVCANSNLDELYVGYFTKFGDNACDIFLLSNFIKSEIYQLAQYYGVNKSIIVKQPSSGLNNGETDENEMGITYANLDKHLLKQKISQKDKTKIQNLHKRNRHKLKYNYIVSKKNKKATCLNQKIENK